MATLKQRLHRKNSSNTYDTVHLESSSDLILRPSGRTVEQDLADYLPEVQANDNVPQSLAKLIVGSTKGFIRGKALSTEGHTHTIAQVTNLQTTLNGKAATSHNHSASQITSGTLSVARGGTGVTSLDALKTALGIGGGSSGGGMIASKVVIGTYSGTYDGSTNASQTITVGDVTELLAVLVVSREGAMYYLGKSSDGFFNGGLAVKGYSVTGRLGTVVSISGNTFTVYSDSGSYGRRGANSSGIHQYIAFGI